MLTQQKDLPGSALSIPAPTVNCRDTKANSKLGILVVDDERSIVRMLQLALSTHGFRSWIAGTGQEAVQRLIENRDQIRLVLLDVRMPGMDGPTTLRELKKIDPNLQCWFVTGDSGTYSIEDLFAAGASKVLIKPLLIFDVLHQLEELREAL